MNYNYDGLGRRIEKEVDTVVTRYIYDNEDVLLKLDGSNNIVARYTHGPGIDEPLIMEKSGVSSFYHADGLGSITELTDTAGMVVQAHNYSSFGKIESQLDPNFVQPYTFTSREFDTETGLYFYRARSYDPLTGRFLQEDPLNLASVKLPQQIHSFPRLEQPTLQLMIPSHLHPYGYVGNNPVNFVDSLGLQQQPANSCVSKADCEQKARDFWLTCAVTFAVAVEIPLGLGLAGCALSGPGAAVCAAIVTVVLETPLIASQVACFLEYRTKLRRCG